MINHNSMLLGEKLKNLRIAVKMTQDDIAGLLDMSRTSFSKYENGAANPPLSVLRQLAAIYNVRLEYLIYNDIETVELHDEKNTEEPDFDSLVSSFGDLTHDEKLLIMKTRLMSNEHKKDVKKFIEDISENVE